MGTPSATERGIVQPIDADRLSVRPMTPDIFNARVDTYVERVVIGSPQLPKDGDFKRLEADKVVRISLPGGGISEARTQRYEIELGSDRLGSFVRQVFNIRREVDGLPLRGTPGEMRDQLMRDARDSEAFLIDHSAVVDRALLRFSPVISPVV